MTLHTETTHETVMGCDPHLDTLTVAVINGYEAATDTFTVPNTTAGWDRIVNECQQRDVTMVGIEGASGYGRCLAETLTGAGITVNEVPTRLTTQLRRIDGAAKTDPADAIAAARATARGEGAQWADTTILETIRLLNNRRETLVGHQTAAAGELRALLIEVDPHHAATLKRLGRSRRSYQQLLELDYHGDVRRDTITELIHELAAECLTRFNQIRDLEDRIGEIMPPVGEALINEYVGVGVVTAAHLLAQLAGTDGFATDAKLAAWAGTAPLDVSSGRQQRHRYNPRGNRQANRAIHTIAITQLQQHGEAADYIQRRLTEGKTKKEAIRAVKRHITRRIWKTLRNHQLT